jgi:hypothetical protein
VPGPKVFITYRREETAAHAGRLYDAMVARFGEGNVFMDVDMAPGIDFVERITEAVAACQVLIVVMGPRWATVEDEQGKARIANPEDFVRLEVETALRRPDVTPIPVLVSGARMPKREDLPTEIQAITRRNALELSDQRWRYDIGRLISRLDELLAEIALAPGAPSPERSVPDGRPAPADAAQAPAQAAPRATAATTEPVEPKPSAPPTGVGRWLRSPLPAMIAIAATAIAAIVVAIMVFSDRSPVGSTPTSAGLDGAIRRLESLVPPAVSCEERDEPVAGAVTLECAAGSGLTVHYAQFETRDELDDWYAAKVPADLDPGSGSCEERPFRGERPYVVDGEQVGRFVCFFDNQGDAQLVWKDARWTVGGEASVYESEGTPGAGPGEEGARLLFRAWSGRMQLGG